MTKMLNACTLELDEVQDAIDELLEQLDCDEELLSHSAGFITCSYDFIENGFAQAIGEAMPFDVVGCTTLTNACDGEAGTMLLCLSVITSDECQFACAMSGSLAEELDAPIKVAYESALAHLPGAPSLVLVFAPLILSVGGEIILSALDKAVGGVPIFGTLACDAGTSTYDDSYTLCGGQASREGMALMLVHGDIDPVFFVTATSEDKMQKQAAIITDSEGCVVKTINNMPARDYLVTLRLFKGEGLEGMSSVPFMVDYQDGTQPVARALYSVTPEGWAVCGGAMPRGATLSIGVLDFGDIMATADGTVRAAIATGRDAGLVLFPCLGRSLVLGADLFAETDQVEKSVDGRIPYHLAYSGGEICPVYDADGKPVNRFHNFTNIACIF